MDDMLVCFPMKAEWERLHPTGPAPFPTPLVSSRDGQEMAHAAPSNVVKLATFAKSKGWDFKLTYAEGWVPHATTGKPIGPKVSWAIRMRRGVELAAAVFMGTSWTTLVVIKDAPVRYTLVEPFKEGLT